MTVPTRFNQIIHKIWIVNITYHTLLWRVFYDFGTYDLAPNLNSGNFARVAVSENIVKHAQMIWMKNVCQNCGKFRKIAMPFQFCIFRLILLNLPDITLDPLYQVTRGIGFPPPDSQVRRNSWPSWKGPIIELVEISRPSVVEMLKFLGSAEMKNKIVRFKMTR